MMFPRMATASGMVVVAKAGENRFSFTSDAQAKATPCKVSSEDTGGACWSLGLCPAQAHFYMFIIAKTSGTTFLMVNLSLGQAAKNSSFQRAVVPSYPVASRMCGQIQPQPKAR